MFLDSELPCSGLASSPNGPEILHDLPKVTLQLEQPESKVSSRIFTGIELLIGLKSCHCSQQTPSVGEVKVVQSINCASHHRKRNSFELLPQPPEASALRDNVVTDTTVFEAPYDSLDFVHGDGQLSSYLNEHKETFLGVTELLTIQFSVCNDDGKARCAICSSPEGEREHSQEKRGGDAQERTHGRPSLPPNHTVAHSRTRTRAHSVPELRPVNQVQQHPTHSLIPLWIGRHSDMRPRARVDRPQGVKDVR